MALHLGTSVSNQMESSPQEYLTKQIKLLLTGRGRKENLEEVTRF